MDFGVKVPDPEVHQLVDFKIFTDPIRVLKQETIGENDNKSGGDFRTSEAPDRSPRVIGIGSSDVEDLAGDRMLKSALEEMTKFSVSSGVWLNHSYNLPEDLFGMISTQPVLKIMQPDGHGAIKALKPYYAVEIVCDVIPDNERALKTFNYIRKGIKIGFSIGCKINDYELRKDKEGKPRGLDIKSVTPLEWSTVGIKWGVAHA